MRRDIARSLDMPGSAPPSATVEPDSRGTYLKLRGHVRWWWPLVALFAVIALFLVSNLAGSPAKTVARVTFVNTTAYDIDVNVSGAGSGGTLALGTARANRTTDVQDVVDQGRSWVLHFGAQGVDGGAVRMDRADLERASWRVTIPAGVAQRLAGAGLQASPSGSG
jgi:hypothetical protein